MGFRQYRAVAKLPAATLPPKPKRQTPRPAKPPDAVKSAKVKAGQDLARKRALLFVHRCAEIGLPTPIRECRFWPGRRFALDFAWPTHQLALESEGGTFGRSRHTSIIGFATDCVKYNEAALRGWRVLRVRSSELNSEETLELVKRALGDLGKVAP